MRVLTKVFSNGDKTHCDARCHNSTRTHCDCICHGLLHGYGEAYAKLNAARSHGYACHLAPEGSTVLLHPQLIPDRGGR